jgi:drug/metabolite transporter (DMT)-like permease
MTRQRAIIELLIADIFWGFSFVAIPMAQESWTSSQITFIRFAMAALVGFSYLVLTKDSRLTSSELRLGIAPGFLFAATIYLQTYGLQFTTPSKSSFITVLYVLFVPIIESFLKKKTLSGPFWLCLASSLFGMTLLLQIRNCEWHLGDAITLLAAIAASWHIHQIGQLSKVFKKGINLNIAQCFWAALFISPLALFAENSWMTPQYSSKSVFGLFMIVFGATILAFTIQARVQRYLSLSTCAVLFLLESPLAMFFSWSVLKEPITPMQLSGAIIVLISCFGAIRFAAPD